MAELWQGVNRSPWSPLRTQEGASEMPIRALSGKVLFWIAVDLVTILGAAMLATLHAVRTGPMAGAKGFWHGTLIHGRSMGILTALLCGFAVALITTSHRFHLYAPARITSFLSEQRLSVQACLYSGLLLAGTLYLIHAGDIPRSIVLSTVGLVTLTLSLRRIVYRMLLYRRFQRGVGTRNVLIVGTGPEAVALRHHLESIRRLGYAFKGFIECAGAHPSSTAHAKAGSADVVGTLDTLFEQTRSLFVDEILFATTCEPGVLQQLLDDARIHRVDLRLVPDMYEGLAWKSPIEYIGQFPTIPLHSGRIPEASLLLKRFLDLVLASLILFVLSPLVLLIALAIRLDSPGPVLYFSERIGKKGRVFRCIKFRTMVRDAEKRRADVLHMNERDGILFKIRNDPRITKLGGFLRKYSLDELPQFINVLRGDMSIVGPRPPLASEVREYKLNHLRRLDVMPGITGLWQVQARQDPSFDSYISLDLAYVEGWSIWLDLRIIARTVFIVFAGTGA